MLFISSFVLIQIVNGMSTLFVALVPCQQQLPSSQLLFPGKVSVSPSGQYLAIADTGHHRVLITSIAGLVKVSAQYIYILVNCDTYCFSIMLQYGSCSNLFYRINV